MSFTVVLTDKLSLPPFIKPHDAIRRWIMQGEGVGCAIQVERQVGSLIWSYSYPHTHCAPGNVALLSISQRIHAPYHLRANYSLFPLAGTLSQQPILNS